MLRSLVRLEQHVEKKSSKTTTDYKKKSINYVSRRPRHDIWPDKGNTDKKKIQTLKYKVPVQRLKRPLRH